MTNRQVLQAILALAPTFTLFFTPASTSPSRSLSKLPLSPKLLSLLKLLFLTAPPEVDGLSKSLPRLMTLVLASGKGEPWKEGVLPPDKEAVGREIERACGDAEVGLAD